MNSLNSDNRVNIPSSSRVQETAARRNKGLQWFTVSWRKGRKASSFIPFPLLLQVNCFMKQAQDIPLWNMKMLLWERHHNTQDLRRILPNLDRMLIFKIKRIALFRFQFRFDVPYLLAVMFVVSNETNKRFESKSKRLIPFPTPPQFIYLWLYNSSRGTQEWIKFRPTMHIIFITLRQISVFF